VAIVLNPALDARDLLATVCEELRIAVPPGAGAGLKELTDALHRFLLDNHARGRKTVLMIDEAQHLDFAVLEQIRLLTNLETHEEKLLHIILIGQPELAAKLARPELRQLNQRITARYDLQPLNSRETAAYILHRLQVAGMPAGTRALQPMGCCARFIAAVNGIPRLINLLCERTLLGAYGRGAERPDRGLLQRAAREVTGEFPGRRRWPLWVAGVAALFLVLVALWTMLRPAGVPRTFGANPGSERRGAGACRCGTGGDGAGHGLRGGVATGAGAGVAPPRCPVRPGARREPLYQPGRRGTALRAR
jgi:general secretion pathway protein A